jgi:hypothetical protein
MPRKDRVTADAGYQATYQPREVNGRGERTWPRGTYLINRFAAGGGKYHPWPGPLDWSLIIPFRVADPHQLRVVEVDERGEGVGLTSLRTGDDILHRRGRWVHRDVHER